MINIEALNDLYIKGYGVNNVLLKAPNKEKVWLQVDK